jgi:hypothetical protein
MRLLTLATLGASVASPKRALMVSGEGRHVPATRMSDQHLREKLRTPAAPRPSFAPGLTTLSVLPREDLAGVRCKPDPGEDAGMPGHAEPISG